MCETRLMRNVECLLEVLLTESVQIGYFVFRYLKYDLTITSSENVCYTFGEECWETFLVERVNWEDVVREIWYEEDGEISGKFSDA